MIFAAATEFAVMRINALICMVITTVFISPLKASKIILAV
jgi:hypothetical protein